MTTTINPATITTTLVNELHDWIDKQTHLIKLPKVSDSLFIKINVTLVKKQKNTIQISVRELHNDMIFPIYQECCWSNNCVWK